MFDTETRRAIEEVARRRDLKPAALLAIAEVESAGVAWWVVDGKRRPAIRFEGHYFYRLLRGERRARAVREGLASPQAGAVANPRSYAARYGLLARAMAIDPEAALRSTSWGLGQVMGDHHATLGYASAREMVEVMQAGVAGQVEVMVRYIDVFGLRRHVERRDWHAFARAYNGPGYKRNRYAAKMAAAWRRYAGRSGPDDTVIELQRGLKALGYDPGPIDGRAGARTRAAVRQYQEASGLVADGIAGPMTREALAASLAARAAQRAETGAKSGAAMTAGGLSAAAGLQQAGDALTGAGRQLEGLAGWSPWLIGLAAALTVAGVGLTLWSAFGRSRSGVAA